MSVRECAELGMRPLNVAQSGARSRSACRHRVLGHLLPVCFAHSGTCWKQTRRCLSIESCTSVLTQAVRARVVDVDVDVWCYVLTDFRATEVPPAPHLLDVEQANVEKQQCF